MNILYNEFYVKDFGKLYLRCVYFVVTACTTVGYGDIYAPNVNDKMFVMLLIMAG